MNLQPVAGYPNTAEPVYPTVVVSSYPTTAESNTSTDYEPSFITKSIIRGTSHVLSILFDKTLMYSALAGAFTPLIAYKGSNPNVLTRMTVGMIQGYITGVYFNSFINPIKTTIDRNTGHEPNMIHPKERNVLRAAGLLSAVVVPIIVTGCTYNSISGSSNGDNNRNRFDYDLEIGLVYQILPVLIELNI